MRDQCARASGIRHDREDAGNALQRTDDLLDHQRRGAVPSRSVVRVKRSHGRFATRQPSEGWDFEPVGSRHRRGFAVEDIEERLDDIEGIGKTTVVLCSPPISVSVCR